MCAFVLAANGGPLSAMPLGTRHVGLEGVWAYALPPPYVIRQTLAAVCNFMKCPKKNNFRGKGKPIDFMLSTVA